MTKIVKTSSSSMISEKFIIDVSGSVVRITSLIDPLYRSVSFSIQDIDELISILDSVDYKAEEHIDV